MTDPRTMDFCADCGYFARLDGDDLCPDCAQNAAASRADDENQQEKDEQCTTP
jgi:hypothetical protein